MASTAGYELGDANPSRFPLWIAGAQVLGTSRAACPDTSAALKAEQPRLKLAL